MIDDAVVLRIERMRDDAESLKADMRSRYSSAIRPVVSQDLRDRAASLAERWLVEVAAREDISKILGGTELADRNIQFQRLLTCAERSTQRKKYDQTFTAILKNFRAAVVVPLKAGRHATSASGASAESSSVAPVPVRAQMAFIGQSFSDADRELNDTIARALTALGLTVLTGEKPKADQVSRKVKERIDKCDVFVGIFGCRDKLEGRNEWATSAWIVDEKAYALARQKKLVLLKEEGVSSIGGLQGDYEYLEFRRNDLANLVIKLVETFRPLE